MNIEIKGRTFTVERKERNDDALSETQKRELAEIDPGPHYVLTGARGVRYFTVRNKPDPTKMFLVKEGAIGKSLAGNLDGVWLTDRNGVLEVTR